MYELVALEEGRVGQSKKKSLSTSPFKMDGSSHS